MAHIHTEPGQHDATASAFIIRIDGDEPRVLLHLHKKLNSYMQFGGHVELDETPWQAIVHEIKEESGYDISQLKILQPKVRLKALNGTKLHPYPVCINTHPFNDEHSHSDIAFAFVADGPPADHVTGDESNDFKLASREELIAMPDSDIIANVREIYLFILETILKEWEQVTPPLG